MFAGRYLLSLCLIFLPSLLPEAANEWHGAAAEALVNVHDLEKFLDGVMATQLAEKDVVGATLAIVKDGNLLFSHGYGYTNLARETPVDPAHSLFRIGSISELFIWTAVMQQLEEQKLQLDEDLNNHLEVVQIPRNWPQPISLIHLMTHTPGFEDRFIGTFARGQRSLPAFDDALQQLMPVRVRPPGQFVAFSNYGAALAARVVENTSGKDWDSYLEQRIFLPLGMQQITSRQPVPDRLKNALAQGYLLQEGAMTPWPFEYVSLPPAGSVSASALSMAKFMQELLNSRSFMLMSPDVKAQMFLPLFHSDPRLNGVRHGFFELSSHGIEIIGHGGATLAFHSLLALYPKENTGLFVSYNASGGADAAIELFEIFNRTYFAGTTPKPEIDRVKKLGRFTGSFASLRVPESTLGKLLTLFDAIEIKEDPEGYLLLPGPKGPRRFVSRDENLFVELEGEEQIAFSERYGIVTHLSFDKSPHVTFERLPWNKKPDLNVLFLLVTSSFLAGVFLFWPISSFRHRGEESKPGARRGTLSAVITAALLLGFLATLATHTLKPEDVVYGLPPWLMDSLWLPLLSIPFVVIILLIGYQGWVNGYWWTSRRIHYSLIVLASASLLWWMAFWRVLDFSLITDLFS